MPGGDEWAFNHFQKPEKMYTNIEKTQNRSRQMRFYAPMAGVKPLTRRLLLLAALWMLGSTYSQLAAQCALACNDPDPDHPLQIALDQNCSATIVPDVILEAPEGCPGDKQIVVRTRSGSLIVQGSNELTYDFSNYIDQIVSITVIDDATGTFCTSYAEIVDNLPPQFDCVQEDIVISCTADTSVNVLGIPDVSDNCTGEVNLTYTDQIDQADCNSTGSLVITRRWTARDASGNTSFCTQSIVLRRPNLNNIVFPADMVLSCDQTDASPEIAGFPLVDDLPIDNNAYCDLTLAVWDDTTRTCNGNGLTIVRTWRVIENCSGDIRQDEQVIQIKDGTPPVITCPGDISVNTVSGESYGTVNLPYPEIRDNCDSDPTFIVSTSYGGIGMGPHYFVPAGEHFVQYTAIDACGNTTSCTVRLLVEDSEAPTVVCDDQTTVSLPDGGVAIVAARAFDNGSSDNVKDTLYFKTRRMDVGGCNELNGDDNINIPGTQEYFDDHVFFCCEDIGSEPTRVILRVYEVDPGPGPVDPSREAQGGDLFGHYNECMLLVRVEDKLSPTVVCPLDQTVDCSEDFTDLSRFGDPQVFDNCSFEISSTENINLDNCGTGELIRTFIATDVFGNTGSCTQRIVVENQNPLTEEMITWPEDVEIEICGASTEPEDLPEGFDKPLVEYESCSMVALSFEDTRFDVSYPSCYKILRRWTIIDWCLYNPDESSTFGRFSYTQVIKVTDNEAPALSTPEDVAVGVATACQTASITIPPVVAEDCSPNIIITNDSPYARSNGADASGDYPLGETVITFTARDRCGNTSETKMTVTVTDNKAPSPICIVGVSVNLAVMDSGELMAMLDADIFNGSSRDNCTDEDNLAITIRRAIENPTSPPEATNIAFTCADLGNQLIEMWATDEAGNSDYCLTYVSVQDNNELCPAGEGEPAVGNIAGGIATKEGKRVEDVMVEVESDNPFATITGSDGFFELTGVPLGTDYTIKPVKDDGILNGVSTYDMILISKHILGVQQFETPYQYIAADVDRSGNISTLDLIRLRKLILNKDTEFPNGNDSWRFVDANYTFPDGVNPLDADFPEQRSISNFSTTRESADFIGIKVGDVNGSVRPNSILEGEARTTDGDMIVRIKDRSFESGETFTVDLSSRDLFNLTGYQFTLGYDSRLLELVDITPGDLPRMSDENFGVVDVQKGLITTSWNELNDVLTLEEGRLFTLTFRAIRSSDLFTALRLHTAPTPAEAYVYGGALYNVQLQMENEEGQPRLAGAYQLFQNHPNPFDHTTMIGISLPRAGEVNLKVFDAAGRLVHRDRKYFAQGYSEFSLSRRDLNGNGLYYYVVQADEFTATNKMMLSSTK